MVFLCTINKTETKALPTLLPQLSPYNVPSYCPKLICFKSMSTALLIAILLRQLKQYAVFCKPQVWGKKLLWEPLSFLKPPVEECFLCQIASLLPVQSAPVEVIPSKEITLYCAYLQSYLSHKDAGGQAFVYIFKRTLKKTNYRLHIRKFYGSRVEFLKLRLLCCLCSVLLWDYRHSCQLSFKSSSSHLHVTDTCEVQSSAVCSVLQTSG